MRAFQFDPGPDEVFQVRELGIHDVFDPRAAPAGTDQQVLTGGQRAHTLSKAIHEIVAAGHGLARNRLNKGQHVLGAVVYLAQ